ncbi:MAG: hypothetical protein HY368_01075 [Candidatus Aenigmarchaeota archaeon]|nr:hypothetical protein [Candidatus Aenigmarchaeota archaeon]
MARGPFRQLRRKIVTALNKEGFLVRRFPGHVPQYGILHGNAQVGLLVPLSDGYHLSMDIEYAPRVREALPPSFEMPYGKNVKFAYEAGSALH